jgi:DNA repair protein RadC
MLAIRDLPFPERPRERCRHLGARALSSVELMAIVVGAGSEGRSAIDLGRDVLGRCQGSLREVAKRPIPHLIGVPGVGPARAVAIHAALELGRRMMLEEVGEAPQILSGEDIYRYYMATLSDLPVEELRVGILDTQLRLRSDVLISRGALNGTMVHAREVFRQAITEGAYAIVLVHNHPSGDPTPSDVDLKLTEQLMQAGNLLDIPVLDHVIIGRGRYSSMAG